MNRIALANLASKNVSRFLTSVLAAAVLFGFAEMTALVGTSQAQVVPTLFSFSGANGANPLALTQGRDGLLYGVTASGGTHGMGTVFRMSTGGELETLYDFSGPDGSDPNGLTLASDGNFYGTAYNGGNFGLGILFKITTGGALTVLHHFSGGVDGSHPAAPPSQAADNSLYGGTAGVFAENSTIFKFSSSGTFSTILSILSIDGSDIVKPLLLAQDGTLIALAGGGGARNCGSILKITTSGVLKSTFSLKCGTTGSEPTGLLQAADGTFYGTTYGGGALGFGTIYHLDSHGVFSVLYNFGDSADGILPGSGLNLASDQNYYGATTDLGPFGSGTIYEYSIANGYTELFGFLLVNSSLTGPFSPMQYTSGAFFGVTAFGGANGLGSVYTFDAGLGPYIALQKCQGKVGQAVQILGQGLTSATSVTFNGVKVTKGSIVSDTYMTAVVPAGATTGAVVVATPAGNLTSNVSFRISK